MARSTPVETVIHSNRRGQPLAWRGWPQAWARWLPLLALLSGIGALQRQAELPEPATLAALAVLGLALLSGLMGLMWRGRQGQYATILLAWRGLTLSLAFGLLGFAHAGWQAHQRMAQALPAAWEGRDLWVQGQVDSLPQRVQGQGGVHGWRFEFELTGPGQDAAEPTPTGQAPTRVTLPRRLLLSWYGAAGEPGPGLRAGESWRFKVRLKRPHALLNPQGFDGELWMLVNGLGASGSVRLVQGVAAAELLERADTSPATVLLRARQALRDAIEARVPDPVAAGILSALSLGDQAAIARAEWSLFRDAGIAHLMSISGMHVTMFAWLMAGLSGWAWRRSSWLCLRVPAPMAAMWLGVLAALAYALFSGWAVPSQRTVWMLTVLALLRHAGLRWPWTLSLLLAAAVVCVLDPWALTQAGFWLSFVAVALLMGSGLAHGSDLDSVLGEHRSPGWRGWLREGWRSQWVATLGLAPLSVVFFQQLSLAGVGANLLAIPLVSFVLTPLALLGVVWGGLWDAAAWLIPLLLQGLRWLCDWPWAVWQVPVAAGWAQVLGLIGGAMLVLPWPWRMRALGLGLCLPLLWPAVERPPPGDFELLAADVGQGNAVLLRTHRHALLYDTGTLYAPGSDAGQRVLVPLLRSLGVRQLDVLMLSHRDLDHVGGAASVLSAVPVRRLTGSLEPTHPLRQWPVPFTDCQRGQAWHWDGVDFELLQPGVADPVPHSNAQSCLLRVSNGRRVVLLAGDMEAAQEALTLQREPAWRLRSDVLLVPHHGSKTSSTSDWVAAVQPRWAVVQAGYLNRFGHPTLPVLARYQAVGATVVRSDHCGAWTWRSVDDRAVCERAHQASYWRWREPPPEPVGMGPEPEGLGP